MDINSVLTDIQNNTTKVYAEKNKALKGSSELGQDSFLQLLMTQLKYQDPMNPMNTQDFMAQQAQFTQISELQKLNKTVTNSNQIMQASSLIGKDVTVTDPDNVDLTINGIVSEAKINSTGASITMNGKDYNLDSIISIKEAQAATNDINQ